MCHLSRRMLLGLHRQEKPVDSCVYSKSVYSTALFNSYIRNEPIVGGIDVLNTVHSIPSVTFKSSYALCIKRWCPYTFNLVVFISIMRLGLRWSRESCRHHRRWMGFWIIARWAVKLRCLSNYRNQLKYVKQDDVAPD